VKAIVLCCAAALVAGTYVRQTPFAITADWGAPHAGLRMAISSPTTATETRRGPQFIVAIQNVGESDFIVNLGYMISNGTVMLPEAVRLVLADPQGTTRELEYFDRRYPGIAGRVDDFVVALRAGSSYTIRVSLDHYWSRATKEFGIKLARGHYRIEASLDGQGARHTNLDTPGIGLLNFWKGQLRSNSFAFEVQ